MTSKYQIFLISDSTGETLDRIFLALQSQFANFDYDKKEFVFIRTQQQINKVIKECNKKKVPVILITNQGGIGLGLQSWDSFAKIQTKIINELSNKNAKIDGVIACPHHPLALGKYKHKNHPCRKPNGGMFSVAKKLFKIDLKKSWMVGDKINDLKAANAKGLKQGFLVLTGYGKEEKGKINFLPKKFFKIKILSSLKKLKVNF